MLAGVSFMNGEGGDTMMSCLLPLMTTATCSRTSLPNSSSMIIYIGLEVPWMNFVRLVPTIADEYLDDPGPIMPYSFIFVRAS